MENSGIDAERNDPDLFGREPEFTETVARPRCRWDNEIAIAREERIAIWPNRQAPAGKSQFGNHEGERSALVVVGTGWDGGGDSINTVDVRILGRRQGVDLPLRVWWEAGVVAQAAPLSLKKGKSW
jgi:hypothetical protein